MALFSCSAGQESYEFPDLKHGIFCHHVLEGWKGAADGGDGQLDLDELVSYTRKQTQTFARLKLASVQTPQLRGEFDGTWVLRKSGVVPLPKLITSKSTGMKLTLIPAGTFLMGSSAADLRAAAQADSNFKAESAADEQQHSVRISQPFYMGVHEVTQGEYESVMGTTPSDYSKTGDGKSSVGGMDTSKFPVEHVSWFDAIEFCNKLSVKDGLTPYYSLTAITRGSGSIKSATVSVSRAASAPGLLGYRRPTEAEWEYACRANAATPTLWHTGNTLASLNEAGWWGAFSTPAGNSEKRTNRVGQKLANSFGLYDMHGNVFEWFFDVYDESVYGKRSGTTSDPTVTSGSEYRVLRGGSWNDLAGGPRTAVRDRLTPDFRVNALGFRVVCLGVRTP